MLCPPIIPNLKNRSVKRPTGEAGLFFGFGIGLLPRSRRWFAALFVLLVCLFAGVPQALAERLPEFLAKTPAAEIFPGADGYGAPEGKPMVARALKGGEPLG